MFLKRRKKRKEINFSEIGIQIGDTFQVRFKNKKGIKFKKTVNSHKDIENIRSGIIFWIFEDEQL